MKSWSPITHFSYHLQPIIKEIPSYVKNTKYFFQKINQIEEIPEDSLLVPLDVKSLWNQHIKPRRNKSSKRS